MARNKLAASLKTLGYYLCPSVNYDAATFVWRNILWEPHLLITDLLRLHISSLWDPDHMLLPLTLLQIWEPWLSVSVA
jgi:hypothetical protein